MTCPRFGRILTSLIVLIFFGGATGFLCYRFFELAGGHNKQGESLFNLRS